MSINMKISRIQFSQNPLVILQGNIIFLKYPTPTKSTADLFVVDVTYQSTQITS